MSKADGLAHCRAGLATEEIISMLSAITGRMRADDPVCEVLDKANDALMDHQEAARIEDLWVADDAACKRGQAAGVPAFLMTAI